ncbi:MAG: DUF4864 domain-containing protein [Alphaproteobacteria bacterium]
MHSAFIVLLFGLTALTGPGSAEQAVAPQTAAEFRRVIERQFEAFRRGDGMAAFAQASPEIRALFRTPDRFMAMVEQRYMPVYRPRSYRFEDSVVWQGRPTQPVHVIGPDGAGVLALYFMEHQPDGSWRIGGVELVALPEREI